MCTVGAALTIVSIRTTTPVSSLPKGRDGGGAMSDLLRRAIVRATKELWQADASGKAPLADAWMNELTVLIREYQTLNGGIVWKPNA